MLPRIFHFYRQAGTNFLRASLREQDKPKASSHGLASQAAAPRFLFCLTDIDHQQQQISHHIQLQNQQQSHHHQQQNQQNLQALQQRQEAHVSLLQPADTPIQASILQTYRECNRGRSQDQRGEEGRSLALALQYSALLLLGYHLVHDRVTLHTLLQQLHLARYFSSELPDYCCPVAVFKQQATAKAQPCSIEQEHPHEEALEYFLNMQEKEHKEELVKVHQEELVKQQQEELVFSGQGAGRISSLSTSDYSSCSSSRQQQEAAAPAERQLLEGRQTVSQSWRQQKTAASAYSQAGRQEEPVVFSQAEKQLLELEETVIPLEMEASRVIQSVRAGGSVSPLQSLARRGSSTAQFYLGLAHQEGKVGLARDLGLARHYYRQAAEQGHPEAMYNLAVCLLQECATSEEGLRWLKSSARLGVREARGALGEEERGEEDGGRACYERARLWEQEVEGEGWIHALELYRRAGEAGHKGAVKRYKKLCQRLKRFLERGSTEPP